MRAALSSLLVAFVGVTIGACGSSSSPAISSTHGAAGNNTTGLSGGGSGDVAGAGAGGATVGASGGGASDGGAGQTSAGSGGVAGAPSGGAGATGSSGTSSAGQGGSGDGAGASGGSGGETGGVGAAGDAGASGCIPQSGGTGGVAPWPMFQGGPGHTGLASVNGPQSGHWKWRAWKDADGCKQIKTPGLPEGCDPGGPVIGPTGWIYLTVDQSLYAFGPAGKLRCSYTSPDDNLSTTPAVGPDGTVYISTLTKLSLMAFSENCCPLWSIPMGGNGEPILLESPTVGPDGVIYVTAGGGTVLRAILPDGTSKWDFHDGSGITGRVAIGPDGTVYVKANGGLDAISPDGVKLWAFDAATVSVAPTVGPDGSIYVAGTSLLSLSASGTTNWSTDLKTGSLEAEGGIALGPSGLVFVATTGATSSSAVSSTGEFLWTANIADEGEAMVVGADGTIYMDAQALDPATGLIKWSFDLTPGKYDLSDLAIGSDGTLYGFDGAYLNAYGP